MLEKMGEFARKNAGRITVAAFLLLVGLFVLLHFPGKGEKIAASAGDRLAFLASLGWEAEPDSEEARTVTVPDCGEGAMADYNALMLKGGYDLSRYEGKELAQYTYRLTNYPDVKETVYLTLYVYRGRVVGGDIHTASLRGFMHELRANEASEKDSADL